MMVAPPFVDGKRTVDGAYLQMQRASLHMG